MSDWSDGGFDWGSLFGGGGDWTSGFDLGGGGDPSWTNYGGDSWTGGYDLPGGGDGHVIDTGDAGSDWSRGGGPGSGDINTPGLGSGGGGGFRIPGMPGGGSSTLEQIARSIGLSNGPGMGGLLGGLLPMLASLYGGIQSRNATQDASRQIQESVTSANTQARDVLGGAAANFTPYMDAGKSALGKLSNMPPSDLASQYKPIGSGRGLNLAQIVKG